MRITILANSDLPSNYALNLLVRDLWPHDLTIFLSDRVGKPIRYSPEARHSYESRNLPTNYPKISFNEIALKTGRPIRTLNSINTPAYFEAFRKTGLKLFDDDEISELTELCFPAEKEKS